VKYCGAYCEKIGLRKAKCVCVNIAILLVYYSFKPAPFWLCNLSLSEMRDIGCEVTIEGSNYQNTFKDPKRI